MTDKTDKELLKLVTHGKYNEADDALRVLYGRYSAPLFRFMYFMLERDENKANDFLQDIFLRIFEKNYRFDYSQNFKSWLFTIAANLCKNEIRRLKVVRSHRKNLETELWKQHEDSNHDLSDKLWENVNRLDEKHRQAIIFRYKLNWQVKEIAAFQNCPEGTVKSRLFFALKKLAEKMEKYAAEYFKN